MKLALLYPVEPSQLQTQGNGETSIVLKMRALRRLNSFRRTLVQGKEGRDMKHSSSKNLEVAAGCHRCGLESQAWKVFPTQDKPVMMDAACGHVSRGMNTWSSQALCW